MAYARRFSSRRAFAGRRRAKRQTTWANHGFNATVAAATLSTQTPLGDFETDLGGDLFGWTVMRTLITGTVCFDTTANAEFTGPYALGIYVSKDAEATSLLVNGSDPRDFLWYHRSRLYTPAAITAGNHLSTASCHTLNFDIRARRRFTEVDDVLQWTVHNGTSATAAIRFNVSMHMLLAR